MKRWIAALVALTTLWLTGCATTSASLRFDPLPTLIPTPTASIDLQAAQRVAMLFLDAWHNNDLDTMYRLISIPSQEATSLEQFRTTYTSAQNEMTLANLTYRAKALARTGPRMASLSYDVTFVTNNLGTFSDPDRSLTLVIDPVAQEWRVAWSPGDIFAEMGNGARLELTASVPRRANIYDRNGVTLADQNGVYVVPSVIPQAIPDRLACIAGLAEATSQAPEAVRSLLNRSGVDWVVSVGAMDAGVYEQMQAQLRRDCDASFNPRSVRQYTAHSSALPHIIGNVGYPTPEQVEELVRQGYEADTIIGQSGVELSMDAVLRGRPGGRLSLIAANGQRLRVLAQATSQVPESIWLTIDVALQAYIQRTLREAYANASDSWARTSEGGAAVVLDVNTGEILALVSYPDYDPNAFTPFPMVGRERAQAIQAAVAENEANPLLNRTTQGTYPAGSTMKVVDAIAIQDSGIYAPTEAYYCSGSWQQGNDRRFDWWLAGHGRVTTQSALTQSCNPFFYEAGYRLNQVDPYLLPNYARRLGLGAPTGLTGLAEAAGLIADPEWVRVNTGTPWTFSNAVSMAIGQGELAVTPLQMTRMYAAIANGGTLYRPQLVRERGILDQRTFLATPEAMSTFDLAPHVLPLVHAGLCDVPFGINGTATHIFNFSPLEAIGVCGKTGTAQSPGTRPPHSWFIAWGPEDEPEVVFAVMIENSGDGSAIAAPLVRQIMEYYFFGPFD